MKTCPSCGGIIGQDCWNPDECAWITQEMQRNEWREEIARQVQNEVAAQWAAHCMEHGKEQDDYQI